MRILNIIYSPLIGVIPPLKRRTVAFFFWTLKNTLDFSLRREVEGGFDKNRFLKSKKQDSLFSLILECHSPAFKGVLIRILAVGCLFLFYLLPSFAQTETDGPYVLLNADSSEMAYQVKVTVSNEERDLAYSRQLPLKVNTDQEGRSFTISIKPELSIEPSVYTDNRPIVAISDIEGNFQEFRELLQAAGVMDKHLIWDFGDGHLVLTGDFFDRGTMVTECLWLIYKLEEEAKKSGGRVHFILGNHETMNLQGDIRYVNAKYQLTANALNIPLSALYSESNELGRWLRTKNIIEKIGDHLFVHAGVSQKINELSLSIEKINTVARPVLDLYQKHENDTFQTIMWGEGPLWYRGYYGKESIPEVIDQTLQQYEVSRIITGHTVVADSISIWYEGKVINIDTRHSEGFSEALLIENGNYYAIDKTGRKRSLFPPHGGGQGEE